MKRKDHRKGITLAETLVVTGVLGVLAALVLPQFAHRPSRDGEIVREDEDLNGYRVKLVEGRDTGGKWGAEDHETSNVTYLTDLNGIRYEFTDRIGEHSIYDEGFEQDQIERAVVDDGIDQKVYDVDHLPMITDSDNLEHYNNMLLGFSRLNSQVRVESYKKMKAETAANLEAQRLEEEKRLSLIEEAEKARAEEARLTGERKLEAYRSEEASIPDLYATQGDSE